MAVRALSAAEQAALANLPAGLRLADRLLREKGLPGRRNEQWKWSDLRAAFDENVQFTVRRDVDARGAEEAAERNDFIGMLAGAFGGRKASRSRPARAPRGWIVSSRETSRRARWKSISRRAGYLRGS